jgi:hypothetical protein
VPHFAGETLNEGDSATRGREGAGDAAAGGASERPEEGRLLPTETETGTGTENTEVANNRRPTGAVMRVASLTNWGLGTDKGNGAPQLSMGSASSSHRAQTFLLPVITHLAILLLESRRWRGHIREKSSTLLTFSSNQNPEDVQ